MPSKAQWDKMKKFFLLPTKHPGIPGTEEKLFKAYEEAKTNHEKLEIVFHLPIIEVICALLLNLCIIYSKILCFLAYNHHDIYRNCFDIKNGMRNQNLVVISMEVKMIMTQKDGGNWAIKLLKLGTTEKHCSYIMKL